MSVEEIRPVFEEELSPEMREMRKILSNIKGRPEIQCDINQIRTDSARQHIGWMQRSNALEARISSLEAAKRISR